MYSKGFIPLAPLFVEEVRRRNGPMVRALAEPLSSNGRQVSRAMHLAVRCNESLRSEESERGGDTGDYPEILDRIGFRAGSGTREQCDAWHPYRAGPEQAEPVRSDIATLVFTGEFDPITHRSFGALAVEALTNGHVVEIPAMGHGVFPPARVHPGDDRCVLRGPLRSSRYRMRCSGPRGWTESTLHAEGSTRSQAGAITLVYERRDGASLVTRAHESLRPAALTGSITPSELHP